MFLAASSYAKDVDWVFYFITYISVILLGLIIGFMLFCVVRYSKKRNPVPSQIEGHVGLEITWTIIPTIIVMMMFYYAWRNWIDMKTIPKDAMEIKVIAKKWSWYYEYKYKADNGETKIKGSDTLVVPVNKNIKLRIQSLDVIHSFYVPAFRMKQDAVPGTDYFMWFRAINVDQEYYIFCAEYCGDEHAYMKSRLKVYSQEKYDKWLHKEPPADKVGEILFTQKGACTTCHSIDGSKKIGPTLKGIFGRKSKIISDGKEKTITVDEEYIIKSMNDPQSDIVKGFESSGSMTSYKDMLSEDEMRKISEYLKTLK